MRLKRILNWEHVWREDRNCSNMILELHRFVLFGSKAERPRSFLLGFLGSLERKMDRRNRHALILFVSLQQRQWSQKTRNKTLRNFNPPARELRTNVVVARQNKTGSRIAAPSKMKMSPAHSISPMKWIKTCLNEQNPKYFSLCFSLLSSQRPFAYHFENPIRYFRAES